MTSLETALHATKSVSILGGNWSVSYTYICVCGRSLLMGTQSQHLESGDCSHGIKKYVINSIVANTHNSIRNKYLKFGYQADMMRGLDVHTGSSLPWICPMCWAEKSNFDFKAGKSKHHKSLPVLPGFGFFSSLSTLFHHAEDENKEHCTATIDSPDFLELRKIIFDGVTYFMRQREGRVVCT
jgi:hypothetical protein